MVWLLNRSGISYIIKRRQGDFFAAFYDAVSFSNSRQASVLFQKCLFYTLKAIVLLHKRASFERQKILFYEQVWL